MFTVDDPAVMDELDIASSSSSGSQSRAEHGHEPELELDGDAASVPARSLLLGVQQHLAHDLTFGCQLGYDATDRVHYLHVGFGTGRKPCVVLTLAVENLGGGSCTLQRTAHSSCCCVGGGIYGTVPMVRGALLAAAQLEPFRGCREVCLNDSSHKPGTGTGTACSDVHIILHASMMTWYEEKFGAVVGAPWAERLAATRRALSRPVDTSARQFADQALPIAQAAGLLPWWRRSEAAVKAAFEAAARQTNCSSSSSSSSSPPTPTQQCTWAQLFASLAPQLADTHASFLRILLALLAKGELCPGWSSSAGFGWAIPMHTIRAWTHVSISLQQS